MNRKLLLILLFPVYLLTLLLLLFIANGALAVVGRTFILIYLVLCFSAVLLSVNKRKGLNLLGYAGFLILSASQIYQSLTGMRIHFWKLGIYFGAAIVLVSTTALLYQLARKG